MSSSNVMVSKESGFTLIELSIVLVIIGLIVGGILTGQDLIKAAEQRATIAQIEKYNTAVNTFRNKFNGIPGDLQGASALSFGLVTAAPGGTTGVGDGNGLIQDPQATNANTPVGEPELFWLEMSAAQLVDGSFGNGTVTPTTGVTSATTAATDIPLAKLGRGNYIIVGSSNAEGINAFGIVGISTFTPGAAGTAKYTHTYNMTPLESFNIDKKVDDGLPNTGSVQARGNLGASTANSILNITIAANGPKWTSASAPIATDCVTGTGTTTGLETTAIYAVGSTPGGAPGCALRFRFN